MISVNVSSQYGLIFMSSIHMKWKISESYTRNTETEKLSHQLLHENKHLECITLRASNQVKVNICMTTS